MDDAGATRVLMSHMGGQDISKHPMYDQFKAMSLAAVAPFSQGMITDDMLAKINADLAQITEATPVEAKETRAIHQPAPEFAAAVAAALLAECWLSKAFKLFCSCWSCCCC